MKEEDEYRSRSTSCRPNGTCSSIQSSVVMENGTNKYHNGYRPAIRSCHGDSVVWSSSSDGNNYGNINVRNYLRALD